MKPDGPNPEPNIVLVMASIIAAEFVKGFPDNEFNGMKTPRYEAAMWKALTVARSLYKRSQASRLSGE